MVTCNHVVGSREDNTLTLRHWGMDGSIREGTGEVLLRIAEWDIAVIKSKHGGNNFVEINANIRRGDPVVGLGFPTRSGREEFDQFSAVFEGETVYRETGGNRNTGAEGKLKGGQIESGFSGGPLLNMRTRAVAGMVIATRDRRLDLGGWIVQIDRISHALERLHVTRDFNNPGWHRAVDEQQRLETEIARGSRGSGIGRFALQAPPLPSHYVERTDALRDVIGKLVSDQNSGEALAITAVHGLGGVGKTSMAIAVARSANITERFPDGILWSSLGQSPQILQTMTHWLRTLGETLDVPPSVESGSAYLRTLLQHKSMLIVIDDAWDDAEVFPLLVAGPVCRTLITTRRAHVADRVGAETWTLNSMTQSESLALLAKRSRAGIASSPLHDEDAKMLITQLGHLPLALELAGALAGRGYSWSDIRHQLLATETDDQDAISSAGQTAIDKCLALSVNLLAVRDYHLWESFIRLGAIAAGARFDAAVASHFLDKPLRATEAILAALHDDALLQRVDKTYVMHE